MDTKLSRFASILFVVLGGCAATDDLAEPTDSSNAQSVSREVYEFIQCSHCEQDFKRVALPADYELPTEDVAVCMAYVFDKQPDSRNLLVSALMECVEESPTEAQ